MKNVLKRTLAIFIVAVFLLPMLPANGSASDNSYFYMIPEDNEGLPFAVASYERGTTQSILFLPNTADQSVVTVRSAVALTSASGSALVDWSAAEGYITVDTSVDNYVYVNNRILIFMKASLPSLSVTINEGESLQTIHQDKNAKIGAKVRIDGAPKDKYNLPDTDIQIKTRGYTSFQADKKPYQIKFDKKQDLFGMGKAKKWILLANYYDGSMIRTKLFFDLADEIGMDYVSKSVFVDLYIDGDYMGVYQLIEKIEVGSTRVDLKDEAGVILEMECNPRLEPDDINFISQTTGKAFVYKDYVYDFEDESTPEKVQRMNEIKAMVEGKINAFEAAIYAAEPDWDVISSMIDVDSFIKYFFLNEYGEQVDCTFSSTYFYIDGPDDVIHCGPIWDFDRCCGYSYITPSETDFMKNIIENTDYYRVSWFKELFRNPEFSERAGELYDETIKAAFDADKVVAAIDSYQAPLMPSLMMNYAKWPVCYNDYYTADHYAEELEDQIAFTTNSIKNFLTDKKPYLDKAYGADMPTILFRTYTYSGSAQKTYSGGSISQSGALCGLKVELVDSIFDGGIIYRLRCGDTLTPVSDEGEINHATNGYQSSKALFIKPLGNLANYISVQYRIHYNGVWGAWTDNGHGAGIPNNNGYIDQIQVRLIKNKEVEYSNVTYVAEGFETVTERGVVGNVLSIDRELNRHGYNFTGWYIDEDRTIPADDEYVLESGDYTFYAGFDKIPLTAGDVNMDGSVDLKDIKLLKSVVAGTVPLSGVNGDVNGDGSVDSKDVKVLKGLLAS